MSPISLPTSSVSFLSQHGVIVADEEEYFIEPLSPGANVSAGNEGKGSPHVVYKRSSLQYPHMDAACGVLGICTHQMSSVHPSAGWESPRFPLWQIDKSTLLHLRKFYLCIYFYPC